MDTWTRFHRSMFGGSWWFWPDRQTAGAQDLLPGFDEARSLLLVVDSPKPPGSKSSGSNPVNEEKQTRQGTHCFHLVEAEKVKAQVISPTACGALCSARTTPQPSQNLVEPWWNPAGNLVEPSWNLTSGPPRTTPEPIWAETQKLSAVGGKIRHVMEYASFHIPMPIQSRVSKAFHTCKITQPCPHGCLDKQGETRCSGL